MRFRLTIVSIHIAKLEIGKTLVSTAKGFVSYKTLPSSHL